MGINQRAEITMTPDEIQAFLATQRTANLITLGPTGHPHAIAMWFAVVDGVIWFETKAKAQKAANIRRDSRATILVEAGLTYDCLRGVSFEGHCEVIDDPETLWTVGVSLWERYNGPYTADLRAQVERTLHHRVAVRFDATRTRSWDHRKLGLAPMPLGGSTAPEAKDTVR